MLEVTRIVSIITHIVHAWISLIRLNIWFSGICAEPRGGNQEEFDNVLKGYYDSVSRRKKPAFGRKRRMKKTDDNVTDSTEVTNCKGAAFLAVFRGKVCVTLSLINSWLSRGHFFFIKNGWFLYASCV